MNSEKVGALIAELRKEKGLTQAGLAEKLNISNRTVSKWENGDGYPDITILFDLANVLGVTVDELLKGETESEENETVSFDFRFTDNRKSVVKMFRLVQSKKKPVSVIISIYLLTCAVIFAILNTITINDEPIMREVRITYYILIVFCLLLVFLLLINPYLIYFIQTIQYKAKEFPSSVVIKNDMIIAETGFKTISLNLNELTEFVMNDEFYVLLFGKRVSIGIPKNCVEDKDAFESYIKPYAKTVLYPKFRLKYKILLIYCLVMAVALIGATFVKMYVSNDSYFYKNIETKKAYFYDNSDEFNNALKETEIFYSQNREDIEKEIAEEEYADYSQKVFSFNLYKIDYVNFFSNAVTFEPGDESVNCGYVYYNEEEKPKASDFGFDSEYYDKLEETYSEKDKLYLYGKTKNGSLSKESWYLILPLDNNWYYFEIHY